MRVPVRRAPETHVSERQQGYARPVQPLSVEPITRVIEGFRDQLLEEQDDRQRVGLNRELIQEVNGLQEDFVQRQHDREISPVDFAANTNAAYEQRHQALIGRLRSEGYRGELLDDFETRLGTIRQGFLERGLAHQVTQLRARAGTEIESITRATSQYAGTDWRNYPTARDMLHESIQTHPDLTEEDRTAAEHSAQAVLRDTAMRRFAIQDPNAVIAALDPQGLTAPTPPAVPGQSTAPTNETFTPAPGADRVMNYQARAHGFQSVPAEVQTLGQASDFASRVNQAGVPSSAMGLFQITGDTLRHFAPQVFGTNWRDQAFNPETQDRVAEAIFNSSKDSATSLHNRWSSLTIAEAERVRHLPWAQARVEIMQGESGGSRQPIQIARAGAPIAGGSQLTDDIQPVDIPPSQEAQQHGSAAASGQTPIHDLSAIRTGNPLIDDLDGRERLQLLGLAREQLNRVTAAQRAQMDVTIANITAEAMNNGGEIATPMPTEQQVLQAYPGPEGPQRWAQLQTVHGVGQAMTAYRTQSATDIQRSLDALRPTPGSPTYATQMQVYEHAQQAAQTLLQQRQQDPAAYVMQYFPAVREAAQHGMPQYYAALDRAYQTLGINPATAPLMTADAARELATQYRTMNPQQRFAFMAQNWSMGEDRFRRFVHGMEGTQAETDANIYALFRSYQPGPPMAGIYQDVLIGRDAIAQDPARRPRGEEVTREFRTQAASAIRDLDSATSRAIQDAAEGLYVQRGGNNNDGSLNTTRYREALRTAMGGSLPVAMGHGRASGYRTILPPGVTEPQFRGWIDRQTLYSLSIAAGNHAPYYGDLRTPVQIQDIIDSGTFVMTSPGYYMIRMASDGMPLMAHNTRPPQPFLVHMGIRDVRSATPTRPVH